MKKIIAEISEELHKKIKQYAFDNNTSMKQVVINALEQYFKGAKK